MDFINDLTWQRSLRVTKQNEGAQPTQNPKTLWCHQAWLQNPLRKCSLNGNISRKIMELNGGSSSNHVRLPESTLREFSGKAPASGGAKTTEKAFHSNTKQWKNMRTEVLVAFW
jgi:hypothetical protein